MTARPPDSARLSGRLRLSGPRTLLWLALATFVSLPAPAAEHVDLPPPLPLAFEQLASFPYLLPGALGPDGKPVAVPKQQIPESIRAFDGKRVAITGFLMPLELKDGQATQAVLLRSQLSCCYGVAPNFNEFVVALAPGRGLRPVMDVPVTLVGTLKVGESYEDGYLVGLFRLDVERLEEVPR